MSDELQASDAPAPDDRLPSDPWPTAGDETATGDETPVDWTGLADYDDPNNWPVADDDPPPLTEDDFPQWLLDELSSSEEAEHASWLASMPDDVRAEYLAGPYTGAGEAIPVGFTHRDGGGPSGAGFAAGARWIASNPARGSLRSWSRRRRMATRSSTTPSRSECCSAGSARSPGLRLVLRQP